MKTHEHITPEQQIANQKAEIESLERKVESLERELQKYLDPDSGEINPSMRYHFKSGEAALLEKIQTLERQLGDCLEPGNDLVSSNRLEQRIIGAINALFLPVRCYSKRAKDFQSESQPWWYLREFLFESDLFSDHWTRPEFRLGVDMLNDICQASEATGVKGGLTKKHFERFEFAGRLFGGSAEWNDKKSIAVRELIASLLLIIQNYKQVAKAYVSMDDLYDMLAALKILAFCQKLWTDAKPEPEEKEEAEAC